jgi:NADPH:quinone reductase-like Zn-dependent oxidoreductase
MAHESGLEMRSLAKPNGQLELSLVRVSVPEPGPDEIVVQVQAAPINPSDLGLLTGPADLSTLQASGSGENIVLTAQAPDVAIKMLVARFDQSLPIGNEGAGVVVKAGANAQALLGKTVAMVGGAMYAQYRKIKAIEVLPLPEGTTAVEGASCFVNPLTALAMVETLRLEGHKALVHTAAASNLGQMLNKICIKDGVPLVNIVRSEEQERILRDIGAKYVVNSTSPNFMNDLVAALKETEATLAFDAIGGGKLAGQILTAMEIAQNSKPLWFGRAQASLYLWPPRHSPDRNRLRRRHGLGRERLSADVLSAENRHGRSQSSAPTRARRIEDHVRQSLHAYDFAHRSARSGDFACVFEEGDWREISDRPHALRRRLFFDAERAQLRACPI